MNKDELFLSIIQGKVLDDLTQDEIFQLDCLIRDWAEEVLLHRGEDEE